MLTGGTSGVYYPLGVAIAKIYGDKIPNVKTQVQATKASVENLNLLQQGRGEIAFTLGDSLKAAWDGDDEAGFKAKLDKLRVIGAIYPNYIQIVATADSGIKTLADLKGKSLSVGAPKSGTELNSRAILKAAGMDYKDLGKVEYLPFAESVDLMKNRQLAATLQSAGLGVASLKDLSQLDRDHRGVGAEGDRRQDRPALRRRRRSRPTPTRARTRTCRPRRWSTIWSPRRAVSDDLAYQMTKLIFDNRCPNSPAPTPPARTSSWRPPPRTARFRCIRARSRYFKEKGVLK